MVRALILLLMGAAATVIVLPIVMTSRALEEHGITLVGRVYHKSETVRVQSSGWDVARDITIEYTIPETGGVSFFDALPTAEQYDGFHTHQPVEVRYLLRRDVPKLPLSDILWQIHALPTVRLATTYGISRWNTSLTPAGMRIGKFAAAFGVLLILWRITRSRALGWAAAAALVLGLGILFIQDFPRPTPAPDGTVRRATANVKSIGHIDKLFSGRRSRGIIADQPIDVVGVEFVPQGRTEPVVAVDLIDRGSVPVLKEKSTVTIRYESDSPRTAYVEGATRTFASRNLRGAVVQGALTLAALLCVLAIAHLIGRAFKRLSRSTASAVARNIGRLPADDPRTRRPIE
jgi:hypothetical protein